MRCNTKIMWRDICAMLWYGRDMGMRCVWCKWDVVWYECDVIGKISRICGLYLVAWVWCVSCWHGIFERDVIRIMWPKIRVIWCGMAVMCSIWTWYGVELYESDLTCDIAVIYVWTVRLLTYKSRLPYHSMIIWWSVLTSLWGHSVHFPFCDFSTAFCNKRCSLRVKRPKFEPSG